jgi:two-component system, chemotaxis family, chemotaxis protein CheY
MRLQRISVMFVDDNQNMRELMTALLQNLEVSNIVTARHGEQAIERLESFNVDLILTDWVMEPMDGIALTKWVRTSPDSPDPFLPVIMISGHTEMSRIEVARDAGVNEFIAKPVSALSLSRRIVSVIEAPRPYVRTKEYFGPDRRRREEPYSGEDRRQR